MCFFKYGVLIPNGFISNGFRCFVFSETSQRFFGVITSYDNGSFVLGYYKPKKTWLYMLLKPKQWDISNEDLP